MLTSSYVENKLKIPRATKNLENLPEGWCPNKVVKRDNDRKVKCKL